MKNLLKLSLIVGLALTSNALFAKDGNYAGWSPGDVNQEASAACHTQDLIFSDDPAACQAVLNVCVNNFVQCIHQCDHYTGMWAGIEDAYFYECSDEHISACQGNANKEYIAALSDGGACDYNPSGPKSEINPSKISKIRINNGITPQLPENPQFDPIDPTPENPNIPETPNTPETPDSGDSGNNPPSAKTPTFDGKAEIPSVVNALAGSGCSLNGLAGQEGAAGLLYGLIVLLPMLRAAFKRK